MRLSSISSHCKLNRNVSGVILTFHYGKNRLGKDCRDYDPFTIGFPSRERMSQKNYPGATIGDGAVLRSGGIIYCDMTIGDEFQCGHKILIREHPPIGNNVSVGKGTVIEGNCRVGDDVNTRSMVFVPTHTEIGDGVFIGPSAVLTNDRYPPTGKPVLKGPVIEDNAVIGANATVLPGIRIGKGALVAAGAIVTRDVPDGMMAIGFPAVIRDLPEGVR